MIRDPVFAAHAGPDGDQAGDNTSGDIAELQSDYEEDDRPNDVERYRQADDKRAGSGNSQGREQDLYFKEASQPHAGEEMNRCSHAKVRQCTPQCFAADRASCLFSFTREMTHNK